MSNRRYHRRSKMQRRGIKNRTHNGSKMAPKWLQNGFTIAAWRPLGGPWARPCCRHSPEPSRRGSGTARGVPKNHLGGLGTPLERKVDRFRPPGGSPGGHLGSFLAGGPAGTNKKQKSHHNIVFFGALYSLFFYNEASFIFY